MATATTRRPSRRRFKRARKSRLGLWTSAILLVMLAGYLAILELARPHPTGDELRIDSFTALAESGRIRSAEILDEDALAVGEYQRDDGSVARYNAPLIRGTQSELLTLLIDNRVPTTVKQQPGKRIAATAQFAMPMGMFIVIFGYFILSSRRGTGLFSIGHGARRGAADTGSASFADVAGHEAAIAELREVKEFLADPARFDELGAQVPKGILLFGPPGCGKTLLARALAGEAGASFYSISGSDFVELYVGVGASRVRTLFREARENAPSLVFIDELDSVGRARTGSDSVSSNSEQEQALNQILTEMDGFSPSEGIIVLGATNRADVLDPALLRPGRFDRTIGLALPDESTRAEILALHGRTRKLDPSVDMAVLASEAIGLSGADLANVVNEGALLALRAGRPSVSQEDLSEALHRILEAPERQKRLSQRRRSVATRFTERDRVSFADVAGQDVAVTELREVRDFLVQPERFEAMGVDVPKGVLLHGPPGCGKTMLARALASESNAAFFSVGASEFVGIYAGQGASRVRDLFAEARSMPPAILFIDEIDAIGRARGGSGGSNTAQGPEQEQTLNQLLAEMDGFSTREGVIVLAASNRADTLDPALLRQGRFDRSIGLELPNEKGRLEILTVHAAGKRLAGDTDLADIARRAIGLTGADLAGLMNEAGILAVRANRPDIAQTDLDAALSRLLNAPAEQRRLAMRGRGSRRAAPRQRVTFSDVAGVDDAVEELAEVKDYLADPSRFARMGARPPRGILLSGPPGCGKTLLARAVAGEANAAFFAMAGSEFVEVYVGEGAGRVRDLFGEARSMAPSIVFIDEIDAIGAQRSPAASSGNRESEQTLNQILVELDGFDPTDAVIVMAATNRQDLLDRALVRPGRFDRHITISLPDRSGRRSILDLCTNELPLGEDVDLDVVADLTRGFSGADLASVANEAALLAGRRDSDVVTMAMVEEGIDRAIMGLSSRTTLVTDEERRVVAYHEAGHALVALSVPGATPPRKLTIVARGTTLGACSMIDSHDRAFFSRTMLVGQMSTLLGGLVAEELQFGESGTGPASDLARVGDIARRMVCEYGMGRDLGPLTYPSGGGPRGPQQRPFSEDSARMIDAEVRHLVDEARRLATDVLKHDRRALDRVASALLDAETVSGEELVRLARVR